ncbi:hypothetical protein LCGC14_0875420 [marine sediment metagenome]|uniref:Uncharacterized protein n=1 Tax=marine sediment metagenome TaxID=412755 RepID=A0A0F9PP40_9ZZZZ
MTNTNIIKLLWRRIDALEKLLICYRVEVRPSEKLFTELEKTKKAMENNALEILKAKRYKNLKG